VNADPVLCTGTSSRQTGSNAASLSLRCQRMQPTGVVQNVPFPGNTGNR
jgi:hypothetical protein